MCFRCCSNSFVLEASEYLNLDRTITPTPRVFWLFASLYYIEENFNHGLISSICVYLSVHEKNKAIIHQREYFGFCESILSHAGFERLFNGFSEKSKLLLHVTKTWVLRLSDFSKVTPEVDFCISKLSLHFDLFVSCFSVLSHIPTSWTIHKKQFNRKVFWF